jgi:hypothetical protein
MRTLGVIQRGSPEPPCDLWPRLQVRLRDEGEAVRVPLPALGWREAAALAAALGTLAIVPDPLRFLAASGIL